MTTVSDSSEIDILRAVAHARMYVTSGRGLESVVHSLANADLGAVVKLLEPALERMADGEAADVALRAELDTCENTHLRAFLAAITSTGKAATMRLDELSEQLHAERSAAAEVQAEKLVKLVQVTATVFVLAFVPTIIAVFGEIPENAILPTVKIPWWFGPSWFTILAGVLTTTMILTRSK